ncbi:histidine phosphatase family protein [Actinomadura logoneensis]|uniref:phosphoglycerate mutase (2,3-diphosphoglycerate-dependent) n=1 Tax=Actinomadura logoneensis TaxID=2293572 RepID=A0A372JCR1_9ACTN|nr:histidine phosphatase family protein [Actinomadura logoneensis]RFU37750.1 histidine phosphatase family protein [Actinomadura logoneensis]
MTPVKALEWLNLTRHGESTANVAWRAAYERGAEETGVTERDADVPLSDLGRAQAANLGRWLAERPADERPTLVYSSPFRRALDTARIALDQTPFDLRVQIDERLRDRDQGILEGLTGTGIRLRHPEEYERKLKLGKFYYRPPAGESWADLALRLRSFYRDLSEEAAGERVLIVAHDAIVVTTRYLVEGLTEQEVLEIEKHPIANTSMTRWRGGGDRLTPVVYNDIAHLSEMPAAS